MRVIVLRSLSFTDRLTAVATPVPTGPTGETIFPVGDIIVAAVVKVDEAPHSFEVLAASKVFSLLVPFEPYFFTSVSVTGVDTV